MSKKQTYSKIIMCPNCINVQSVEVPKGMHHKDYTISPDLLCSNCGCRLDGKTAVAKPKEPQQTAGKEWAGKFGHCPFGKDDEPGGCKLELPCEQCRELAAIAFDIGLASKPPEPTDETAFQKAAREHLVMIEFEDDAKLPWEKLEKECDLTIPALRVFWKTAKDC